MTYNVLMRTLNHTHSLTHSPWQYTRGPDRFFNQNQSACKELAILGTIIFWLIPISKMTYTVSSGMLNSTISYHTIFFTYHTRKTHVILNFRNLLFSSCDLCLCVIPPPPPSFAFTGWYGAEIQLKTIFNVADLFHFSSHDSSRNQYHYPSVW